MTFREIDERIEELTDPETGMLTDFEAFEALQMEYDAKVESMVNFILLRKDANAAIDAEQKRLRELKERNTKQAESATAFLDRLCAGNKWQSATHSISYRKSKAVECDADFIVWAMEHNDSFLRYKDPEVDKTAVMNALKNGATLDHARIVERSSISIK